MDEFETNLDDGDQAVESLLRSAQVRKPSLQLDARVNAVFAEHRHSVSRRPAMTSPAFYGSRRLAIAAGLVIAIWIGARLAWPPKIKPLAIRPTTESSVLHPVLHPIEFEQDTSTVYDDGIIDTAGGSAFRQYRRRTVRQIWYEDPQTHARLQMIVPTEQVVIEKVESF
jgi:hypothetical protein